MSSPQSHSVCQGASKTTSRGTGRSPGTTFGTHPLIMKEMRNHPRFRGELGKVADALCIYMHEGPSDAEPFTVAVLCRAGEKRSVAMATLLYHCFALGHGAWSWWASIT